MYVESRIPQPSEPQGPKSSAAGWWMAAILFLGLALGGWLAFGDKLTGPSDGVDTVTVPGKTVTDTGVVKVVIPKPSDSTGDSL